jgi:GNAT superfamily N-acetyltransferase
VEAVPAGYEARPFFADVPGALSLLSATLGERPEFAGMPPEDILACLMAQAGERPDASHWEVAWHEELAWGLVLPTTGHFGTIMALAVRPEARGRGLGRALHAHALTVLKREGMTRYVDHVDARSAAMLAICATHGCRVVDRFWQFRMASPAKP